MANTYTLIASNTLGASAASVTFSAIPATYTDLVLRISARSDNANLYSTFKITYNADTGTNYSETRLYVQDTGTISSATQGSRSNNTARYETGASATSNTFSSFELFLPNYAGTANKPISHFGVSENNSTDAGISTYATLYRGSSAISSIELGNFLGNFVSGSSFFLYGIKNS